MARQIIDTDVSEGYETDETSEAKVRVGDILGQDYGGYDGDLGDLDTLSAADAIVTALINMGWRPTRQD